MSRLAERLGLSDQHERRRTLARDAVALARAVNDPTTLWYVISSALLALREPSNLPERLDLVSEMRSAAESANDAKMIALSSVWQGAELIESGDIALGRLRVVEFAIWAERSRRPYDAWAVTCFLVAEALSEGRLDEADRESQQGLASGISDQNQNAVGVYGAQLFFLRREQDRLEEVVTPLKSFIEQYPLIRAWRCGLALVHAETGNLDAAREEFERLAIDDFEDFPPDFLWMLSMSVLSNVAYHLGDKARADKLAALMAPYAEQNVLATPLGPYLGSMNTYVALCAATAGRWDNSSRHFDAAVSENRRMGMPVLVARTQFEFARMLVARGAPDDRPRALVLLDEALATASSLGMVNVVRLAGALRASMATPA